MEMQDFGIAASPSSRVPASSDVFMPTHSTSNLPAPSEPSFQGFGLTATQQQPLQHQMQSQQRAPQDQFGLYSSPQNQQQFGLQAESKAQPQQHFVPQQQQQLTGIQQQPQASVRHPLQPVQAAPRGAHRIVQQSDLTQTKTYTPQWLQQQQQQQQSGLVQQPYAGAPPVFTLDQLPPDQPLVALTPVQANDVLQALATQGGAPIPQQVDLLDAQNHFLDSLAVKHMAYIHTVELSTPNKRFKHNCKPSLLQSKLKNKQNRLCDIVQPVLEPGQQGFLDLAYTIDGALIEDSAHVWQFGLTLLRAEGVGKTGLRGMRSTCLHIARVGIFDRSSNCFLGNIIGVTPLHVKSRGTSWEFTKELFLVRCSCMQEDPRIGTRLIDDKNLSLYIELNTSYRLDVADTRNLPSSEHKASQMVDEITCAWSMVSFSRCKEMTREAEVTVPLYYGSIYAPQHLNELYKEAKKQKPFGGAFNPKPEPVLVFRAGPIPADPPPLLSHGFLPPTMVAVPSTGYALGVYRACLALQISKQHSAFAPMSDPVLASFERLIEDPDLFIELMIKWRVMCAKLSSNKPGCMSPVIYPTMTTLMEAFRRCVAEVSPLLHSQTLPPLHISNFVEYKDHRQKLIQKFCHTVSEEKKAVKGQRHPVEPLSHAGFEYLHKPFDVAEVRMAAGTKAIQCRP